MTVDRTKFNEIQEIPKGGLLNIQRANGGVLAFDDMEYTPGGGGGITVMVATWSPADVTQDETVTVITLPAGCLALGGGAFCSVPIDPGATGTMRVSDAAGTFRTGADPLTAAACPYALGNGAANIGTGWINGGNNTAAFPVAVYADDAVSLAYVAGMTPGATVPVVEFRIAIISGLFV